MYLDYFNKFKNQEPYLSIDEKEWTHIKDTFDKEDVKESLAIIAMDYPMPGSYPPSTIGTVPTRRAEPVKIRMARSA